VVHFYFHLQSHTISTSNAGEALVSDPIVVLMLIAVLIVWAGGGLGWILPIGFLRKDDGVSRNQRFWGRVIFSLIGIALAAYVILSPDYGIAEKTAAWGAVTAIIGFWFGQKSK
jgi:hypothetical protein